MKIKSDCNSFELCIKQLWRSAVVAYPTEAVFGLGCDPDSEVAVMKLLALKRRSIKKGLILVAADYQQLKPYISDEQLSDEQKKRMFSCWPGPVAWVLPARTTTPSWLTGQFSSLAVRVSAHSDVIALCQAFGKPLVSTSANLSGLAPCRNVAEVLAQFGKHFPVLRSETSGHLNPSEIRDVLTDELIRQG